MGNHRNLRVLDAAQWVADTIHRFLRLNRGILNAEQLSKSANSIPANIVEGFGRDPGRDRNRFLRNARSSSEETNEHWREAHEAKQVDHSLYWSVHHRLVAIVRMLNSLMAQG
jgi:four helix bundle protein